MVDAKSAARQERCKFLIYTAVEVGAALTNAFGTAFIPAMGRGAFFLSVASFFSISVAVASATANKHQPASFVFAGFINKTGWNDGTAWILGLLQGCFVLTAFDATAHLVEEMPHPRRDCPRTMVTSVILGTLTGFIFLACVLLSIQDVDEVISSPIGPLVTIFKQATNSNAGTAGMTVLLMIILFCSSTEVVTTSSRLTAAFARQGGLPFANTFAKINHKRDLPLNAMFLTNAAVFILGLMYLGASSAFNAIVSACVIGLSLSYLIPIAVLVIRGRHILPRGQFHLGRWGYPINIFSVVFLVFIDILFLFPSSPKPNADTMNYSIVAIGAVLIFATAYWHLLGYKQYKAPTVQIVEQEADQVKEDDNDKAVSSNYSQVTDSAK